MEFSIPNKYIPIKKMKRMTKQELINKILEIEPKEKLYEFTHTVLMDILNYHLNRII